MCYLPFYFLAFNERGHFVGSFLRLLSMWHVYVLLCSNGDYYKGCTGDMERRLQQHQQGKVNSTRDFLPVKLICYISFTDKSKAFAFEKYLKSGSGRAFLKKRFV